MKAASREAQKNVANKLDELVRSSGEPVAVAAQIGTELFLVVDQLDRERALRFAITDQSLEPAQRAGIIDDVLESKIGDATQEILRAAVSEEWSSTRDLRTGLINIGRRALLRGAEQQGQIEHVESEIFQLSVLLENEKELTQLLSDRTADAKSRRSLLASVLYGKVTMFTEALALQVIGRPEHNPIDDLAALAADVAALRGKTVARVTSAEELNDSQRQELATKLQTIYGHEMAIHTEVDPSLLGGMIIRVGDEEIDGSTSGKIARLRADLAAHMAH